jgi:hypothetical protein
METLLKHFFICCFLAAALFAAGCAGLHATGVVITSDPSGAHISCNEAYLGDTPLTTTIPDIFGSESVYIIKAEKRGYLTSVKVFREVPFQAAADCIPKAIFFQLEEEKAAAPGGAETPK